MDAEPSLTLNSEIPPKISRQSDVAQGKNPLHSTLLCVGTLYITCMCVCLYVFPVVLLLSILNIYIFSSRAKHSFRLAQLQAEETHRLLSVCLEHYKVQNALCEATSIYQ